MTKQINDATVTYKPLFKGWQAKVLGSVPAAEMLAHVHGLGLRPGKQALACAMALRVEGVTGPQIVIACGAPQLNRMRGLIAAGVVKRVASPPDAQGHVVYKLQITEKGHAAIKRAATVAANAAASTAAPKATKVSRKANKQPAPQPDPLALPDSLKRDAGTVGLSAVASAVA